MYVQTLKIHREKPENTNFSDTQELAGLWSLGRETRTAISALRAGGRALWTGFTSQLVYMKNENILETARQHFRFTIRPRRALCS